MKKLLIPCLIAFFSLLLFQSAFAQDSTGEKTTSYLKYEVNYQSDNVYLGRKDSVKIPYLSPTISYYHKSGVFATASASYLPTESRLDAITLDLGYTFTKNKWDGEFTLEKAYYNSQSYNVKSEVKGSASANIGYDFGPVKSSFTGTTSFGISTDYAASLQLEHSFSISDGFDIAPAFNVNASTQNSYNAYYQKRKYAKTKKGKIIPYKITANALDASRFKIMDYEASAPVTYAVNKFTFAFTPTVAIPENPNMILYNIKTGTGPGITKTAIEKVGTTFFWSVGISYKL